MSPRYFTFCLLATVNCFHTNQHLPLQKLQPPLRYYQQLYPTFLPILSKSGHENGPAQLGDHSDLNRQYQNWQIAIPNQQQGDVVWISAPIYGQSPSGAPAYPPAPPHYAPSTSADSSVSSPTNQNTFVRDTPTESSDDNITTTIIIPSTETLSTNSTTASSTYSTTDEPTTNLNSTFEPTYTTSTTSTTVINYNETTAPPSTDNSTRPSFNSSDPLLKYCKEPRGQFSYPSDCQKFVNCWDTIAVEQSCPNGLAFNADKKYCDYPENVNCTSGNFTNTSPPPSNGNSTENMKCPTYYGTYRNTSNCAAFYVCVYGEPVDFICPSGTVYNDELEVCDYPYRVNCKGIGTPSTPTPEEPEGSSTKTTYPSTSILTESTTVGSGTQPPNNRPTSMSNATDETLSSISTEPSILTTADTVTPIRTGHLSSDQLFEKISSLDAVDPIGLYNFNLKKLPESIVNTGVKCYQQNTWSRLTPDCSSVTVCQGGLTYIVNCGHAMSFDAYSQKCVSSVRATRC